MGDAGAPHLASGTASSQLAAGPVEHRWLRWGAPSARAVRSSPVARTPADQYLVAAGLVDAMPITPQATTSRVVVDTDAVRVVLFAFDTGEELTDHTAALPVVVTLLDGAVRFRVGGEDHDLAPGDVVYLPAHESHAVQADEPSRLSLVMVRTPSTS
jgi:quercetin dioxygenase-like cupin family protein